MSKYLSLDTEATGLEEHCLLIQVAVVPLDGDKKIIAHELGKEVLIQQRTGLLLDPYFSASKLHWILRQIPDGHARAAAGELAAGTIDSQAMPLCWGMACPNSGCATGATASITKPGRIPTSRHSASSSPIVAREKPSVSTAPLAAGERGRPRKAMP